jgi:Ca2+-binding EF-hand superfamily protein
MTNRAMRIACLGIASLMIAGVPYLSAAAADQTAQGFKSWDTDNDGSIDLTEAKAAAEAKFASLDPDGDGLLDKKEAAAAKVSAGSFAKADSDKDGTIDKTEYMDLVTKRFQAADADHDGTVSKSELHSKAGARLKALL